MFSLPCGVFCCIVFVHSYNPNGEKLDSKALKCVFIDYRSNKKGYKRSHRELCLNLNGCHLTKPSFVCPSLEEEKTLEGEELFLSLPYFFV